MALLHSRPGAPNFSSLCSTFRPGVPIFTCPSLIPGVSRIVVFAQVLHARTFFYSKVSLLRNFPSQPPPPPPPPSPRRPSLPSFLPSVPRRPLSVISRPPASPPPPSHAAPGSQRGRTIAVCVSPREDPRPRGVNTAQTTLDFS